MFFELAQKWWALAIRGVAAILFGLLAFFWPGITLFALVILFAVYTITDGVFAIAASISATSTGERWWALLLEGILGIVAGVLALAVPRITALFLLFIIAFWALITGIFEIITAVRLRRVISNEFMEALSGIASIVFGILLLISPRVGALAVVWWIGAYALVSGVLLLSLALRLRSHGRESLPAS